MYSNFIKRLFVKLVPSMLILLPFISNWLYLLIGSFIMAIILWILYGLIAALLGRTRVDIAPTSILKIYIPFITVSILLYLTGY